MYDVRRHGRQGIGPDLALRIYSMGFGTIEWVFRYFLLGAVIVFPVWLLMRLLRVGRRDG